MANKEVYVDKKFNTEILTGKVFIVDVQDEADKNDYLPLNKLRIANRSSEVLYIYLDSLPDSSVNAPDYVLGAEQVLDEGLLEGTQFNTVYVLNTGAGTIVAKDIIVRVAKAEEIK